MFGGKPTVDAVSAVNWKHYFTEVQEVQKGKL